MSDKLFGVIYKSTVLEPLSSFHNKIYIGKLQSKSIENFNNSNYVGSGKYIQRVIGKYGKEKIKTEILYYMFDNNIQTKKERKKQLGIWEKHFIKLYDSRNLEIGMNITPGGEGGIGNFGANKGIVYTGEKREKFKKSEEAKKRMSLARKKYNLLHPNRKLTEEDKEKKRVAALRRYQLKPARKWTEKEKQVRKDFWAEYYKTHSGPNKGNCLTIEQKKKKSDFWQEYYKTHPGHNSKKYRELHNVG